MAFTAKDVQALRERTGVGMMECKKALTEAEGDMERAVDILRERGLAPLLCLVLSAVTVIAFPALATLQYEARSGIEFGDGVPTEGWLAMGLHDSSRAPGWYNSTYTVTNFKKFEYDTESQHSGNQQ